MSATASCDDAQVIVRTICFRTIWFVFGWHSAALEDRPLDPTGGFTNEIGFVSGDGIRHPDFEEEEARTAIPVLRAESGHQMASA